MSRDQPLLGLGPSSHLSALASFVFYATYKFMRFVQHCHFTLHYPEVWTEINLYFLRHRHSVRATENGSRQLFLWDFLLRTTKQAINSPVEIHTEILYRDIPNINQACIRISKVHLKSEAFGSTEIFSPKLTPKLQTEDFPSPRTIWASQLISPVKTDSVIYTSHSILIFMIYMQYRLKNRKFMCRLN